MHKVAESGPGALAHLVLSAAGLAKVRNGAQLGIDGPPAKPAIVEVLNGLFRILFTPELNVDVADEVIAEVVANVHLLNVAVLVLTLDEAVLEEVVVVFLHLLVGHVSQVGAVGGLGRVLRVDVEILQDDRLRERWLVVDPRASFAVSARPDLEVKRAIHFILLGAEDRGQIIRHLCFYGLDANLIDK